MSGPSLGIATVIRADARALPLADASVDLIVTSPPYWALRSYTDGGQPYDGQIGSEPTPTAYLEALLACTREWMRVLKPTGSIWVQLGDTYSGKANAGPSVGATRRADRAIVIPTRVNTTTAAPYKSLLLLPERYRIACVDQLGLTARAVVVGSKPNGLPESVTDRVRRSHEDWVHLTKQPRYFSAVDHIRRPHVRLWSGRNGGRKLAERAARDHFNANMAAGKSAPHELGALPGSVWEIPTEPLVLPAHLEVDHYAAFATEWPRRLILGWSPSGYCTACTRPRSPVAATEHERYRQAGSTGRPKQQDLTTPQGNGRNGAGYPQTRTSTLILGEACACTPYTDHPGAGARDHSQVRRGSGKAGWRPDDGRGAPRIRGWREYHLDRWRPPPTRPAVILDPFGGTGTTALVAKALGRHGITVDRSADYCRIATWRTNDPGQLAKAMRVPRPPVQADGQLDLFAEPGGAP